MTPFLAAGHYRDDVETARACGAGLQRLQPAPQAQPNSSTSGDLNQKEATRRRVASGPLEKGTAAPSIAVLGSFLIAPQNVTLSGGAEPEALKGARVSANFLNILGVKPVLGRGFLREEDKPGGSPIVLIGSELWQRRFAGDPLIVGKAVTLDSTPYTIIGVLPAGFQFPFAS